MLRITASLAGPLYAFRPGEEVTEEQLREYGEDPERWIEQGLAERVTKGKPKPPLVESAVIGPTENAAARTGKLEPWPLNMEPAAYLGRHPQGKHAALAKKHVAEEEGDA